MSGINVSKLKILDSVQTSVGINVSKLKILDSVQTSVGCASAESILHKVWTQAQILYPLHQKY